jgi:AraC-like DNA-binding protein
MSVLFDVEDEPPAARLDYFRHGLACAIGAPFDVHAQAAGPVRGASIHAGQVGSVGVARLDAGTSHVVDVRRTPALIRRSDPELFKLDLQVRGRAVLEQGDREAALAPGDFTLVDVSRPYRLRGGGVQKVVLIPHRVLPLRHHELARVTAVRASGADGLGAPISALVRHLALRFGDEGATVDTRLSAALIDLLIVALGQRLDRVDAVSGSTRRRALLASVQAFIDRRLADPRLSPAQIAAAHHISLRLLQKLFEEQGTSVGRWIRECRLERCRRDLLDPAHGDLPVNAIAFSWGFVDATHFSRVFRAAYGHPPGEYRRLRRDGPAPLG